jgi:hypothetical protein
MKSVDREMLPTTKISRAECPVGYWRQVTAVGIPGLTAVSARGRRTDPFRYPVRSVVDINRAAQQKLGSTCNLPVAGLFEINLGHGLFAAFYGIPD